MGKILNALVCCALFVVVSAATASAQYRQYTPAQSPSSTIGESYHFEVSGDLWKPEPSITFSSEQLGIVGDTIDGVNDLAYQKTRFKELRLTLRPGKKHKLRFDYIPISFSSETTLKRDIVFNGIKYSANLPVNSSFKWGAYHLGYEYDFLYRDRWFVGVVLEAKYTHVKVDLNSPVDSEYTDVAAPIPAIGGIFRVYPVSYVSFTGEINGFKLPTSVDKQNRYDGKYIDYNFYGTLNLTNNFGAQVGYRNINVMYRNDTDEGHFKLKGMYFGAVARF
jgi:hypothetical protein